MNKKIWIMNHYATNMYFNEGGRHYWFAENLIKQGYEPTIFCANTRHNSNDFIDLEDKLYSIDIKNSIPFVFVKTPKYKGNGKLRVFNMIAFYRNLFPVVKEYLNKYGKPDIILASSVHPLTLVAGIKIGKMFGIPCICEIRDLWPESLVTYGALKRNSLIAKTMYLAEEWIYKKADNLVFTMEGGIDYIIEQGWNIEKNGHIDLKKVHHINNGVDLDAFNYNKEHYRLKDEDLDNPNTFKVVYAGSIRQANNVKSIVNAAIEIQKLGAEDVKFIIYGEGSDRVNLEDYCADKGINNVVFKGFVEKRKIPYILSKSDLNIFHFSENDIKKYGASLNKLFEYFASGKPILSDCQFGYDLVEKYNAGIVVNNADASLIANKILILKNMNENDYTSFCNNALTAARDYDFKVLTRKLTDIIEGI